MAVVFDYLDKHYDDMFEHNKSPEYKASKDCLWAKFISDINNVHGGEYKCTKACVEMKIDNMKSQGCPLVFPQQVLQLELEVQLVECPACPGSCQWDQCHTVMQDPSDT